MDKLAGYFTAAARATFYTSFGWAATIAVTALCGVWLGVVIFGADVLSSPPGFWIWFFIVFPFWVAPQLFLAYGMSVLAWYLLRRSESGKLKLAAATVSFAAWAAVTPWAIDSFGTWLFSGICPG